MVDDVAARDLSWDGCWNVRDLSGIPCDGGHLRPGALVRASTLHTLSPAGWDALRAHGVRTIIDLRTDWERERGPVIGVPGVTVVPVPLEDGLADDPEFAGWGRDGRLGTPLYYGRFLERWPDRCPAVFRAIVEAPDGGVAVHCSAGRDRTGMVVGVLLSALGTPREAILDDYERSQHNARASTALGVTDDTEKLLEVTRQHGFATPRAAMSAFLDELDLSSALSFNGGSAAVVSSLRDRMR